MKNRKPRPKELNDRFHFQARLHERYNLRIDDETYYQMLRTIQGKRTASNAGYNARFVETVSRTRSKWIVDLPERQGIVVIYSHVPGPRGHKSLVTALTPSMETR